MIFQLDSFHFSTYQIVHFSTANNSEMKSQTFLIADYLWISKAHFTL